MHAATMLCWELAIARVSLPARLPRVGPLAGWRRCRLLRPRCSISEEPLASLKQHYVMSS